MASLQSRRLARLDETLARDCRTVSSNRYLECPPSASAATRHLSASIVCRSRMPYSSTPSPAQTSSAASRAKVPANTARRRNSARSAIVSSSWLQVSVALSVCWRSSADRLPAVSTARQSPSRSAI